MQETENHVSMNNRAKETRWRFGNRNLV